MPENRTISKAPPSFPSMDFALLRDIGIKHFEKMGSKLWTDYNLHDPGITILEVLCYAITDLGYRTNFPIEDILASSNNHPDGKQFFSAIEVLTCNPVTVNDFRKVLIDLNGIKNAWLVKTSAQEMALASYKQTVDEATEWVLVYKNDLPTPEPADTQDVFLNGLYDVYIDLDDKVDHNDLDRVDDILQAAWRQLWKHRNLCEDYVSINVIREMEFCVDAQVELCADADVNKVAGEIYYYIQEYLTPTIQFYNFKEMYEDRKKSCEEIFEGPVLCNGFIDDNELDKAQLRNEIYVSDLWQVVMNVCGVAGIRKLTIKRSDGSEVLVEENGRMKWCLKIESYHKPKLNIECSTITFQKEFDCIYPDDRKVLERIALLQKLNQPRQKTQDKPALPQGTDRDLEQYFTIQSEFPFTYKIDAGQIVKEDSELRKAQARQLKGYLLLFDELLANYLLLLSRVKDLLSVSQPENDTYFFSTLYNVPGVKNLIKAAAIGDIVEPNEDDLSGETDPKKKQELRAKLIREREQALEDKWNSFTASKDNEYSNGIAAIIETETKRKKRKNIFLDHLLARFGEVFTGYVTKVFEEQCSCAQSQEGMTIEDELLNDKAAFLKRIPELSSERGKGFNYKALDCGKPDVWDSANVAGLKKRVCMYLGFNDFNNKTLTCPPEFDIVPYRVITDGKVQKYRLRLQDKEENFILDGIKEYRQRQNALKDARDLREQVLRGKITLSDPDTNNYVRVYVSDREDNNALQSEMLSQDEANSLKATIEALAFPDGCAVEGFHIVEHILLRPKDDDYTPLFGPVLIPDKLADKWNNQSPAPAAQIPKEDIVIYDPYSFWITVAVPGWLPQYKENVNAKNSFEQLVRRECPAHIAIKFCWMTPKEMYQFESSYLQWLYENGLAEPNERELTEHVNDLVELMNECDFSIRDIGDPCLENSATDYNLRHRH